MLHTKLLQFYIRNGFIISKLHRVFEYQGAPALSHVYSNVYEARVAATETSDETKSTAIKESFITYIKIIFNVYYFKASLMKLLKVGFKLHVWSNSYGNNTRFCFVN